MTPMTRRTLMTGACAWTALSAVPRTLFAQTLAWPATTRIVVPLPAGGGVDLIVRKLGEVLAPQLGTTLLVENKPGASGVIAAKAVAGAAADGSVIFYIHPGLVTTQVLTGRLNLLADFKPVTKLTAGGQLLLVPGNSPYKTQAQLIAAIQAQPGKLNYGTGGNGSPTHMAYASLSELVPGGLQATQIPFKGAVESAIAMIVGDVDFGFGLPAAVDVHVKSGKLRALATTGRTRLPDWPELPTVAEAGVPGYVFEAWGALLVPSAVPDAAVARLYSAVKAAAAAPEFAALVARNGGVVDISASPDAYADQLRANLASESTLVRRLGLKKE